MPITDTDLWIDTESGAVVATAPAHGRLLAVAGDEVPDDLAELAARYYTPAADLPAQAADLPAQAAAPAKRPPAKKAAARK